ncbi:centrosomin isoform X1 [Scaptodrosophila lebanonensis]|uniref:Centrosomin isoform X1 n=1 Tax=Drosophila lebanonensis TaxID=7225 RepID=A0A6J2UIP2_DROLE|nr:centrosomin isoform X1 [Scaptodrosophila lebanonensis]
MHKNQENSLFKSNKSSQNGSSCANQDHSQQAPREYCDANDVSSLSSMKEITLIETVTTFLEENGAAEVDPKVLRHLAEALSKRIDDTSPGGLQDVTMENSYNSFDAARTQGIGGSSPIMLQGRSVRELEEQMSSLRKENFNLKLRIYFMEEGQTPVRGNNSHDSLSKQLVDLKIEIEVLRKAVAEKTELLKDAARAIEQHEDMQQKTDMENQRLIEQLQHNIEQMESKMMHSEAQKSMDVLCNGQIKRMEDEVNKLECALKEADLERKASHCQIQKLEHELNERQESLISCEAKIEELAIKNAELVHKMERHEKATELSNPKSELAAQLADKMCELQDTEEKLKERERIHEQALRTIQKLMQKLSSQDKEIKRLNQEHSNRKQDNSADAIISGSENRAHSDSEALVAETTTSLKERLAEQEETIKELRAEIKKKTANLQNLVNKELWEKNREVERLTKLLASQQLIAEEGADLQQSCTEQDYTKALERNKLLQRKVDVLIKRLGEEQHNDALISQLRHELNLVRADAESANKWRLECADVCGVLTNRLEELAGFLNSLLKHKDVLGVLAADRRHAMRRAVDRSLDLSKSLNMTLSITGTSLADQSLTQLCNLSEILVADADDCNRTYNSHEEIRAEGSHNGPTMETLKAENKALKRELEKRRSTDGQMRKERRSLPLSMQQQQLDNQSESEAWSEPDRKVSLARMGLDENSQSLACEQKQQLTESDSEGQSRMTSAATRQERARQSERIAHLEELIAQRDERILNVQCQLVDSDNRYKQEQLRVIELSQQLDQLRARNEELQADLKLIGTQEDQQLAELQHLLDQRTKQFEDLQMTHKVLTADAEITEMELQAVRQQFTELQSEHESDLRQAKLEMQQLKQEATEKLEEQRQSHEDKLSRDWIALSLYEEQKQQLLELQRQHVDCMQNLEYHQELEKELKQSLVDNELTARALKKQLDESALQASKAVMERTKAYNDKLQLEERLEQLKTQLALIKDEPQQQQQQQQLRQPPKRLNSSDVSQSGYTSEEVPVSVMKSRATASANAAVVAQRMNNSSPDLGIESDAGRVSSVELSNAQRTQLKTVELKSKKGDGADEDKSNIGGGDAASAIHDCAKVDQENAELRRKLTRTKRAFEDTYEKLRLANKAKAQVEKDIKNQILKTHNVLRNVRSNMENEL